MGNSNVRKKSSNSDLRSDVLVGRLKSAAYKGSKKDLRILLKAGAPIDGCHKYGKTALHEAVRHNHYSCVDILLKHQANVNMATYDGLTPVMEAAEQGHVDCLLALLSHGADANAVTRNQWTALHFAARNGHKECVEILLEHGADVNMTANGGWRALHVSARHGHTSCVELLLQHNAEVDPPQTQALKIVQVPLHHAAEYGHLACLEALLRQGADAQARTPQGWTALHSAALHGRTSCLEALIRYGANVNATTVRTSPGVSYADTPLHLACRQNLKYCVKRLVQANADLWIRNCIGLTPVHFASEPKLREWLESIAKHPKTLQLICVSAVRTNLNHDKVRNAEKLPLPPHLIKCVQFESHVKIV